MKVVCQLGTFIVKDKCKIQKGVHTVCHPRKGKSLTNKQVVVNVAHNGQNKLQHIT
jgi:hypothetical protein